ncbi:acyltransferase domain-containing protein [Streptomyces laurentii]|uniref:acyltransferase domain-containing protein n=1 Tax=Streptomyces laurentii TaxID=39478 RepID=UPI003695A36E
MSLTSHSAVVRRLIVSPGSAPRQPARAVASAAGVSAVLRAFGRSPKELPARTVVLIGTDTDTDTDTGADATDSDTGADTTESDPRPELPAEHEGFTVRTVGGPGQVLRRAHQELHEGTADLALVAEFGAPDPQTITVYAVKRAAEAVADGDTVLGILDMFAPGDVAPPLRPLWQPPRGTDPDRHRLILWSGRDAADEARVREELLPMLSGVHRERFPALPVTVPRGTAPGPVRGAAVAVSALASRTVHKARAADASRPRPIALMFPGQGSQHAGMAAGLYRREPVFTAAVDAVLAHLGEEGHLIRADWLDPNRATIGIDDVRRAQPLLFAIDYALGRMVLGWGVRPVAVLGHSAGELVAATLAGVVSLRDAVEMVRARVREAVKIPAGGMLAVAASEEQLLPYLTGDVAIAAVNANQQVMLAGSQGPLDAVRDRLKADRFTAVAVPASSPFHSPAMAPASDAVETAYRDIPLREPRLPLYSGYTGTLMSPEEARSPRFWARQITDTVYFRDALDELLAADDVLLVEVGPRQTLTAFARRHRSVRLGAGAVVPLLPARRGTLEADRQSVLTAAARIWTEGHDLDLDAVSRLWTWGAGRPTSPAEDADVAVAAREVLHA